MTLAQAVFGDRSLLKNIALVLGGALVIALCAQVSIGWPVPITLQTFAILVIGLSFGAQLGVATLITYLGLGALGFPVFADAQGVTALFGPTAGFLLGFVAMVWIVGYAADRGWTRGVLGAVAAALLASAIIYIPGILWPMMIAENASWAGRGFASYYWPHFIAPFVVGDVIKAVLAAMIVTGALAAIKSRRS